MKNRKECTTKNSNSNSKLNFYFYCQEINFKLFEMFFFKFM